MDDFQAVYSEVAQLAVKEGFSVYLKPGGPMTVKLKQPPRIGVLKPTRVEYKTIAEVRVKFELDRCVVTVDPMVFGNLRPKVDILMASLEKTEVEHLRIVKTLI